MSIEQTLERIAAGIEKLIEMQGGATAAPVTQAPAPVVTQPPTGPGPVAMPQIQTPAPVGGPLVGGPPQLVAVPTPMPGPSGTGPGQAMPQAGPTPVAGPQAAPAYMTQGTAMGIDILDQIRDAANQFHRAHPERAGEVWQILANNGSAGGIDAVPAQNRSQVLAQLQALGA